MGTELSKREKRVGFWLRVLSFVPVFNWASLIIAGKRYHHRVNLNCGIVYGLLTFAVPAFAAPLWIAGIIQYAVTQRKMHSDSGKQRIITGRQIDTENPKISRSVPQLKTSDKATAEHLVLKGSQVAARPYKSGIASGEFAEIDIDGQEEQRQSILGFQKGSAAHQQGQRKTYSIMDRSSHLLGKLSFDPTSPGISDRTEEFVGWIHGIHNSKLPIGFSFVFKQRLDQWLGDSVSRSVFSEHEPNSLMADGEYYYWYVFLSAMEVLAQNGTIQRDDGAVQRVFSQNQSKYTYQSGVDDSVEKDELLGYQGYEDQRKLFFSDMKKYEKKVGKPAPFVPFMHYWPTYRAMDRRQRSWYFYWRSEVRNGNYPDTDLSYIFVYVYELISGCGWSKVEDGNQALICLWTAYRERFPKLDRYLLDWTFSFAQFHGIPYSMPDFQLSRLSSQQAINDYLIDLHRDDCPLKLPFEMVAMLCDYSVTGTKFYKDGHQLLMQEAAPRVVALADAVLRKKHNQGLLELYGPNRTRKQRYYAYQSALCPEAGEGVDISVRAYTASSKLRSYINEVVRYGENSLRKIYGVRGRLRGVSLDEEMGRLIDAFLEKEYNPNKGKLEKENSKTQPKVELDFASIEELRIQSDAVREALNVPEAVEQKELLTDLEEVRSILAAVSSGAKALLEQLYHSDWECEKTDQNAALVREINREANRYLACELMLREGSKWVVEEDYRDELEHIYEVETQLTQEKEEIPKEPDISATVEEPAKSDEEFDVTGLSEEMQALLEALTPVQRKVLMAVLTQENCEAVLEQIAEEEMTMPELLLDELNDTAAQYLDDILVDTFGESPRVLEQYEEELKKAWKGK